MKTIQITPAGYEYIAAALRTGPRSALTIRDEHDREVANIHTEALRAVAKKTPGQIAYERELTICPAYPDGTMRVPWSELAQIAREAWEKDPTPRTLRHLREMSY